MAPQFQSADEILSYVSIVPLLGMILSACFCLGCSSAFHLLNVKSRRFHNVLSRLDYGGISILIFGSVMPVVYYSFGCQDKFY